MDEVRLHGGLIGLTVSLVEFLGWVDQIDFGGKSDCECFLDLRILLIELVLRLYLNRTSRSHGGKLRGQCVFKE